MLLAEQFDAVSPSIVAFISKFTITRQGQPPVFPSIFGTGFFVDPDGIVATNAHVVDAFDQIPKHPKTGDLCLAAILFLPGKTDKSRQMLVVDVGTWTSLGTFSSPGKWYGKGVPDIGFVQLGVREVPFLKLATKDYNLSIGMAITTVGYPMGTIPLTALGKLHQMSPFIRRGIVSSLFPFPTAQPHGFTIDIMQQGGSSGSPIFSAGEPGVVGMMASSVLDWKSVQSDQLSLAVSQNTNISVAEPAATISMALDAYRETYQKEYQKYLAGVPSLAALRAKCPEGSVDDTLSWESWTPGA